MCLFFFNDTATTEIYTLSLHDALPIWEQLLDELAERSGLEDGLRAGLSRLPAQDAAALLARELGREQLECFVRSEEHTSELQSRQYLVCRLLLEKKKKLEQNE